MGTKTPVLGLDLPADGELNWAEQIRQNFSKLDNPVKLDLAVAATIAGVASNAAAAALSETAAGASEVAAALSETAAGASEVAADVSATASDAARAASVAAKTASEAARDAAIIQAGVYVDEPTGRAAVADGVAFKVQGTGNVAAYEYRRVNAGTVSTLIATYPSSAALSFIKKVIDDPVFVVTDDAFNKVIEVKKTGAVQTSMVDIEGQFGVSQTGEMQSSTHKIGNFAGDNYLWAVADEAGNVILAVDYEGRLVANFGLINLPNSSPSPSISTGTRKYDYSLNQIFGYGQSLSVGQAVPAISTTQSHDSLMFTKGMRPQYDYASLTPADWYASLVPAVESDAPVPSGHNGTLGETPSVGTVDMIKNRILDEDGKAYTDHQYRLLISTPGWGATTVQQLSKGGAHFTRMLDQATYGHSLAIASGQTHAVQAVTWTQGESDYLSGTSEFVYKTRLDQLITDINSDIKAITGQSKDIQVISYQTASHIYYGGGLVRPSVALAQLLTSETNPLFHIACAMYVFDYWAGGHLLAKSSRWLGAYYGLAYKRIVINEENWKPLKPIGSVRQGNLLEVEFNVPSGKLVWDTSQVGLVTNYGFILVDSAGAALPITYVEIVDSTRVRITAQADIPAGALLRYGWAGDSIVGKGNLRDEQGNTITFDCGGEIKRMDNWCLIFELGV
ncbi:MAG: hypothetical protein C0406_00625 [Sideroxydans sp.]|nr:hypothetical protein [Sideroxydans sp.]